MMKNTVRKPVAGYERRDVEQFRKLSTAHPIRPARAIRGASEGNTNRLKHGAYANRFLSTEEQAIFHELVCGLREDFAFNASSDFVQVELVGIYFLKIGRALGEDNIEAAHKIDQMLRGHLKDLKATKLGRGASDSMKPAITPAEWATALLEKIAKAEKENRKAGRTL